MAKEEGSKANFIWVPLRFFLIIGIPYYALSKLIGFDIGLKDFTPIIACALWIPAGLILNAFYQIFTMNTYPKNYSKVRVVISMIVRMGFILAPPYWFIIKYCSHMVTFAGAITILILTVPFAAYIAWIMYYECNIYSGDN